MTNYDSDTAPNGALKLVVVLSLNTKSRAEE